jgi:hypothetical protein
MAGSKDPAFLFLGCASEVAADMIQRFCLIIPTWNTARENNAVFRRTGAA